MTDLFRLADDRQVVIYDQVGGGRSSPTGKKLWKVQTFVRELELLIDHLGFKQFHLFGGSWGTTLALEYYLKGRNRHKVASLVFQSPMFSAADWRRDAKQLVAKLPAKERKIIRYCHEIDATDSKVYRDAMTCYYAKHVCRNKAKSKRGALVKNPHGNQVYEYMWGASEFSATGSLKNYNKVRQLERIGCPTLFICGEYDEARPTTAKQYAKKVSDAAFVEIKNASHAILAERPSQLIKTIRLFVTPIDTNQ
jgi:proline iminopeptidase